MVRWSTAGRMVAAWGLTLPAAGLVAAGAALLADQGDWGIAAVAVLGLGVSGAIWAASRRKPVTHDNVNDLNTPQGLPEEPVGVVTAALQAVAPPPAGPSAPVTTPAAPATPAAATTG